MDLKRIPKPNTMPHKESFNFHKFERYTCWNSHFRLSCDARDSFNHYQGIKQNHYYRVYVNVVPLVSITNYNVLCILCCICTLHTHCLSAGEQKTPEFTSLNPMQKVPVLVDNGFVLTERYKDFLTWPLTLDSKLKAVWLTMFLCQCCHFEVPGDQVQPPRTLVSKPTRKES